MTSPWLATRHPSVVSLVTSIDKDHRPNASPKVWWMPTSYEPPMVLLSLKPESDTRHNLDETGCFVLHIPPAYTAEKVLHTAKPLPRGENELDDVGLEWEWLEHGKLPHRLPRVLDMPFFGCLLDWKMETGDHTLFCARVVVGGGYDPAEFVENAPTYEAYKNGVGDVLLHRGRNAFVDLGEAFSVRPY